MWDKKSSMVTKGDLVVERSGTMNRHRGKQTRTQGFAETRNFLDHPPNPHTAPESPLSFSVQLHLKLSELNKTLL